jgi:hypothetical protein
LVTDNNVPKLTWVKTLKFGCMIVSIQTTQCGKMTITVWGMECAHHTHIPVRSVRSPVNNFTSFWNNLKLCLFKKRFHWRKKASGNEELCKWYCQLLLFWPNIFLCLPAAVPTWINMFFFYQVIYKTKRIWSHKYSHYPWSQAHYITGISVMTEVK